MRAPRVKKQRKGTKASEMVSSNGEAEESGEDMAITNSLGDDTLLNILHRLPTRHLLSMVALVCRRWRRLCQNHLVHDLVPPLYSTHEKPWGSLTKLQLKELAIRHASTLEVVELCGLDQLSSNDMFSKLPRLQHLTIALDAPVCGNNLQIIVDHLPDQLITLDLHTQGVNFFEPSPRNVGRRNESITDPPPITDEFLMVLQQRCHHLERVILDVKSSISEPSLNGLLQTWPHLTLIHLNSSDLGWSSVLCIFQSCLSLQDLSLISSRLVADEASRNLGVTPMYSKEELALVMPRSLVSLRVYTFLHSSVPWTFLPAENLMKFKGHQFQRLHAQALHNSSWHNISVWCINLKSLDLSHAHQPGYSLTEMEQTVLCKLVGHLEKVEELALPAATDRILAEIGRHCGRLSKFFFQGYRVRRSVPLSKQLHVTDRGVIALVEGCTALRVLSLGGCSKVTTSSVRVLAFQCKNLEVLELAGCTSLTDDAVTLLLCRAGCSLLFLDLLGCSNLSYAIMHAMLQHIQIHGTRLRVLAIPNSIRMLSRAPIAQIHQLVPFLSVRGNKNGLHWDGFYNSPPWSFKD